MTKLKTKKRSLVFGFTFVIIIVVVGYRNFSNGDRLVAKSSSAENAIMRERIKNNASSFDEPRPARRAANPKWEGEEVKKLRRDLEAAKSELEIINRPLTKDMLSSTVRAELSPDETLVTGGYKRPDGNYEFAFLTPSSVTLSDGSQAVRVQSSILIAGPQVVKENGLDSLATNARNTLQHAEAWEQEYTEATLRSLAKAEGTGVMTAPSVIVSDSKPFELEAPDEAPFVLVGSAVKNSDGNFSVQFHIGRRIQATGQGDTRP